jgi:hypothetical protein
LNGDLQVDVLDIDALQAAVLRPGIHRPAFDLTSDGLVNYDDLRRLVTEILGTSFGDANVNGRFDSADLVLVMQSAEYEDGIIDNSTWAEGDWNADGDFDSRDLVIAFQFGGYSAASIAHHGIDDDDDDRRARRRAVHSAMSAAGVDEVFAFV